MIVFYSLEGVQDERIECASQNFGNSKYRPKKKKNGASTKFSRKKIIIQPFLNLNRDFRRLFFTFSFAHLLVEPEKIPSVAQARIFWTNYLAIFRPKQKLQTLFFSLYFTSKSCFPKLTRINLMKSPMHIFWFHSEKIAPMARARFLKIVQFSNFRPRVRVQTKVLLFFLCFEDLFFKSQFHQLETIARAHAFVLNSFPFLDPYRNFNRQFLTFFILQRLFLQIPI